MPHSLSRHLSAYDMVHDPPTLARTLADKAVCIVGDDDAASNPLDLNIIFT